MQQINLNFSIPNWFKWLGWIISIVFSIVLLQTCNPEPNPRFAALEKENRHKVPKFGDIFIMDFGKGNGHCGMVLSIVGDRIHTIEGNTSSDPLLPAEDREGNGVFERSRKTSSINKGFIRI